MKSLNENGSSKCKYQKGFDLNRAQFLLFLSNIIYERDQKKVSNAHTILSKLKVSLKKDSDNVNKDDVQKVLNVLKESEKNIYNQLEEFELGFTSLSEMNSIGGQYAGMFWSEKENFIVIVCKGNKL